MRLHDIIYDYLHQQSNIDALGYGLTLGAWIIWGISVMIPFVALFVKLVHKPKKDSDIRSRNYSIINCVSGGMLIFSIFIPYSNLFSNFYLINLLADDGVVSVFTTGLVVVLPFIVGIIMVLMTLLCKRKIVANVSVVLNVFVMFGLCFFMTQIPYGEFSFGTIWGCFVAWFNILMGAIYAKDIAYADAIKMKTQKNGGLVNNQPSRETTKKNTNYECKDKKALICAIILICSVFLPYMQGPNNFTMMKYIIQHGILGLFDGGQYYFLPLVFGILVIVFNRKINLRTAAIINIIFGGVLFLLFVNFINITSPFTGIGALIVLVASVLLIIFSSLALKKCTKSYRNEQGIVFGTLVGINGKYSGITFQVQENYIMIGSDPTRCNIVIEGEGVSPVHCALKYERAIAMYKVCDYSIQGTYIDNNVRLAMNLESILNRNTTLFIGNCENIFKLM